MSALASHAVVAPLRITKRNIRALRCICGAPLGAAWGAGSGVVGLKLPGVPMGAEYSSRAAAFAAALAHHVNQVGGSPTMSVFRDEVAAEAEADRRRWLRDEYDPPVLDDLSEDMATFQASADREADRFAEHIS